MARARVDVSGESNRNLVLDQQSRRGEATEFQVERSGRQQHRANVRSRQSARRTLISEDQVIGRACADISGNLASTAGRQFVGMNPRQQPVRQARSQNGSRFIRSEDPAFAEDVAPVGQTLRGDGRNHLVDDERDVRIPIPSILRSYFVGTEKRRHDVDRVVVVQRPEHAELPQLGFSGQTVAALRLTGRCPAREHFVQPDPCRAGKGLLGRRPSGGDGREDAAPGRGDVFVGRAAQPSVQLVAPVPRIHDVRVGIDEAGNDRAPAPVDAGRSREHVNLPGQFSSGPDEDDDTLVRRDGDAVKR